MRAEDLILVSVDDHIVEPPDMFEGRLPAKYQDLAPKMIKKPDGTDVWTYDGNEMPNIGLNAVVGRPPEEYGIEPTSLDEMRPGCFDVKERIRDMNANGVLGSMNFPSFPQFCGQLFARTEDKDVALAMVQAYNDWHIDEWCGTYPGRFIPCTVPAIWDPDVLASEICVNRPRSKPNAMAATPARTATPKMLRIQTPAPKERLRAAKTRPPANNATASDVAAPAA